MFQLESESQLEFYISTKNQANLDEDQLKILESYQKNALLTRHIELQVLDWENSRFFDDLSQHQDTNSQVVEEVDDIKRKCDSTEKSLIALAEYQNSLNEQINELMLFKQPVQHETTYLMTNRKSKPTLSDTAAAAARTGIAAVTGAAQSGNTNNDTNNTDDTTNLNNASKITTEITGTLTKSKRHVSATAKDGKGDKNTTIPKSGNIYLSPTCDSPKLTYNAFTKQLYSCDSIRIEHLLKNENTVMLDGLISLERSIHKILNDIDSNDELDSNTQKNVQTVDEFIFKVCTHIPYTIFQCAIYH